MGWGGAAPGQATGKACTHATRACCCWACWVRRGPRRGAQACARRPGRRCQSAVGKAHGKRPRGVRACVGAACVRPRGAHWARRRGLARWSRTWGAEGRSMAPAAAGARACAAAAHNPNVVGGPACARTPGAARAHSSSTRRALRRGWLAVPKGIRGEHKPDAPRGRPARGAAAGSAAGPQRRAAAAAPLTATRRARTRARPPARGLTPRPSSRRRCSWCCGC